MISVDFLGVDFLLMVQVAKLNAYIKSKIQQNRDKTSNKTSFQINFTAGKGIFWGMKKLM